MEPIFEADFDPCSHGFRPRHRAQDAIADIVWLGSNHYQWVLEADIEACFDSIDHNALMGRVRHRVGDGRVLALVKAFLKAGLLNEHGNRENTITGTPQGGILSPLLANIALSALDDHFAERWRSAGNAGQRHRLRAQGQATYRLVRYADDFVVMVAGTREHAKGLREEVAAVLSTAGLRLSEEKTRTVHIDKGFDFLGFRIQRQPKRGSGRLCVYTFPSKKALASVKAKVKAATRMSTSHNLANLIGRLNPILRGWTAYFRYGSSKATFAYLRFYTLNRVVGWLRRKHRRAGWKRLRRRYFAEKWWPEQDGAVLFDPSSVAVTRYRWRGYHITSPWTQKVSTTG
jgi:RNA-directed DNA polymerase